MASVNPSRSSVNPGPSRPGTNRVTPTPNSAARVERPGGAGRRRDRARFQRRDRLRPEAFGELRPVEALRLDELVGRLPAAVAEELAPAADGPVVRPGRGAACDDRRRALPQDAV